jgi:autotransporter-associated beta strand protein
MALSPQTILSQLFRPAHRGRRPFRYRPGAERLEDRVLLSTFQWNADASGNWNVAANWTRTSGTTGSYPNAVDDVAVFGSKITADRTVTIPDGVTITVGTIQIDSAHNYTIDAAGSGNLVFNTSSGNALLTVTSTTGNGAPTISAPVTLVQTLSASNGSTGVVTLSGAIGGGGGLIAGGAGVVALTTANTYGGATTVSQGILEVTKPGGLGSTANGTTVKSGATLQLDGSGGLGTFAAEPLTLNGTGDPNLSGALHTSGSGYIMPGSIDLGTGTVEITCNGGSGPLFTGPVTGSGTLIKNGTGQLSFTQDNPNLSGQILIEQGTIDPTTASALGTCTITATSEGRLDLYGGVTYSSQEALVLAGTGSSGGGGTSALHAMTTKTASTSTWAGPITVNAPSGTGYTVEMNAQVGATLIIQGAISGPANDTLLVGRSRATSDTGTIVFAGTDTFVGTTEVVVGTLQLDSPAASSGGGASILGPLVIGDTAGDDSPVCQLEADEQILDTAPVTVNSVGTFDLNGHAETIGSLAGSGTVTLGSGALTMGGDNTSTTFSGIIGGTGTVTKAGTGTFTLAGSKANTYTGVTTVNEGTLLLGKSANVNALGGDLVIGDGTNPAQIDTDAVRLSADGQIPNTSNVTINQSGLFDMNGHLQTIGALAITGGDVQTGAGTLTLGGDVTANVTSDPNVIKGRIGGNLAVGSGTRTITANGNTGQLVLDIAAAVSGAALDKEGTGTLQLDGNDSYTGTTTVGKGVLDITSANALGATSAGTIVAAGATLALGGLGITFAGEPLILNGDGVLGGEGALTNVVGNNTWTGPITLGSEATLSANAGTTMTVAGAIGDAGTNNLTIGQGPGFAGTVVLAGADAYGGSTTVAFGTLRLAGGAAIPDNSAVVLDNTAGVTLDLAGSNETIGSLAGGGALGGNVTLGSGTLTTGNDNTSTTFSGTIGGTGGLTKIGTGTFTLAGVAANTDTGATTVNGGTLHLDKTAGVNAVAGPLVIGDDSGGSNAEQVVLLADNQIADGAAMTVTSSGLFDLSSHAETIGSLTGTGNVALGNATLTTGNDNTSTTFGGAIGGTGTLVKIGTGTFTFAGTEGNTYTGTTTVDAGTLVLDVTGTAAIAGPLVVGDGSGGSDADVVKLLADNQLVGGFNVTVASSGLFNVNGFSQAIGSLSGSGDVALGSGSLTTGSDGTSTIFSGVISGTGGALTKVGTGTLTLSGASANTDTGTTTVSAGTLLLAKTAGQSAVPGPLVVSGTVQLLANNQLDNAAVVTVNAGGVLDLNGHSDTTGAITVSGQMLLGSGGNTLTATGVTLSGGSLSGTGTVNANLTNGGLLNPGGTGAVGTLTVGGGYTQTSAGALAIDVAGSAAGQFDVLAVSGAATLDGTLQVSRLNGFLPNLGTSFPIVTFGSGTGTFASATGLGMGHGQAFAPVYSSTDVELTVQPTVADHLAILPPPSGGAGQALSPPVQVQVIDQYGFVLTTDQNRTVTIAVAAGPGPFTNTSTVTASTVNGVASFGNLVLDTAGRYTLTATATGGLTSDPSARFAVVAAAADHLGIQVPAQAIVGGQFTAVVSALDPFGNTDLTYAGSIAVQLNSAPTGGKLVGTTIVPVQNGRATFGKLSLRAVGTYQLRAASTSDLLGAVSTPLVVAPTTHFAVSGVPAFVTAGQSFAVTITALTAAKQVDTSYAGTVGLTSTDPWLAVTGGPVTFTPGSGQATVTVTLQTPGQQTITATDVMLPTARGTSGSIQVGANGPPPASHLGVTPGLPGIQAGNQVKITVTALAAAGQTDTAFPDTIHFASSDPHAGLPKDYTFLPSSDKGTHTFDVTLGKAGTDTITVTDVSRSGIRSGTASVVVTAGAVSGLDVTGYPSSDGSGQVHPFTVTAVDASHNRITGYLGTVSLSSSDTRAVLPVTPYTFTAGDHGAHVFSAALMTPGTWSLSANDFAHSLAGQETNITVVPATTHLGISGVPATVAAGQSFNVVVTALNAVNRTDSLFTETIHFASDDPQANLPPDYTFQPGDQGIRPFPVKLNTAGAATITVTDVTRPTVKAASVTRIVSGAIPTVTAGISGPAVGVRGQPLPFTLTAGETGFPAGTAFTYRIDWDGNGTVDQVVTGPGGLIVNHVYPATGNDTAHVTVVDALGNTSALASAALTSIQVVTLEPDPLDGGATALAVGGTTGNNLIVLSPATTDPTQIMVSINGVVQTPPGGGAWAPTGHILVFGQSGNDTIEETTNQGASITVPALLSGGGGTNTLSAVGSSTSNVLVGGTGKNLLSGGGGEDILIGGGGPATLHGGARDDVLIGGSTVYDANTTALLMLLEEWGRMDRGYPARVQDLFGNGSGGLNGPYVLDAATVARHTALSQLQGGGGSDWFWFSDSAKGTDTLGNYAGGEAATFE